MTWTWVEPFTGAAACALRLVGGRDLAPPVAWMGGKRRYASAILGAMGVPEGRPSRVVLCDAGPWGWVWPLLLDPADSTVVAAHLRGWSLEHPRALWERLASRPPAEELRERAAGWLWLQARSASGVPIWWDGWRPVMGKTEGRKSTQPAWQKGGGEEPADDRGEDLRWPGHQAQREAWMASDGRGEPRPAGARAVGGRWEKGHPDGCGAQDASRGQRGWLMGEEHKKSRRGDRTLSEKGTSHGRTGGMVNPGTIADRVEAISRAFGGVEWKVHHGDAADHAPLAWRIANRADPECRILSDRHYTRRTVGSAQFVAPGRPLVLHRPGAVWVTLEQKHQDHAWPGAWVCSIFRNESPTLSSLLIRSAVEATVAAWGPLPTAGLITFVDAGKTVRGRSARSQPGACFRHAGWIEAGRTPGGHGRPSLVVLRAPVPEPRFVYLDPLYQGATGYGWGCPRAEVLALARRWAAAGAVVAVSEAVPLELPGWHHLDLTRPGGKPEWLTLSRPPARVPERQLALFGERP